MAYLQKINGTTGVTTADADTQVKRIKANRGTTLAGGNFTLSASFGSSAAVGSIAGTDTRAQFTITSVGTGQSANPTITLTFADGTYTTSPFAIVTRNGGDQPSVLPTWSTTGTTLAITFPGTPAAGETYTFAVQILG